MRRGRIVKEAAGEGGWEYTCKSKEKMKNEKKSKLKEKESGIREVIY
jgi:hypothetical protein